ATPSRSSTSRSDRSRPRLPCLPLAKIEDGRAAPGILASRQDLALLDLLRARGGGRVGEERPPRRLEVGAPPQATALQRLPQLAGGRHVRPADQAGHYLLLADLAGDGEYRHLRDRVVGLETCLDLRRRDVLS